ncbi:MAG: hypothetical protein ACI9GM_000323 [Salibacteraceae bacterium]|jgi:hypothetical protein
MPTEQDKSFLLSPKIDGLTIGGLSIVFLPIFLFLIPNDTELSTSVGWALYGVAFLVNYPHFTVSYQLLYLDYGKNIWKEFKFFWAGVLVPVLLIAFIIWSHVAQSVQLLAYFVEFMFVIVGWHYVKQSYGAVMVTSSLKNYSFSKRERNVLKFNMYALWLTSFLSFNIGEMPTNDYWGIKYYSFNFPIEAIYTTYALTALSLLVFTALILKKILKTKVWPPLNSILSFGSIYAWFLPVLYDPIFFLAIPFFHSIQYFTFVIALKKREGEKSTKSKKGGLKLVVTYLIVAIVSGALLFELIPRVLDVAVDYNHDLFGQGLFLFLFSVSINIHHYFIDNVIWRRDNTQVSEHLFH